MVMQVIAFSLDRIIKNFMLIYLILEENNIYRKSSHFFFFFYEGKLHALTIKLFDDMKEIKKEKFALHCIVSIKSALHCIVSNFLHCTISLLLMFLHQILTVLQVGIFNSVFFGFNFVFLSWFMYGCQCLNSVLILKFMLMLGVFLFLFCILDLIELQFK